MDGYPRELVQWRGTAKELLAAALPAVPEGMRWADPVELPASAGYAIRLFDDTTQLVRGYGISYELVCRCEDLPQLIAKLSAPWVMYFLSWRPWAGVLALVRRVRSEYHWRQRP